MPWFHKAFYYWGEKHFQKHKFSWLCGISQLSLVNRWFVILWLYYRKWEYWIRLKTCWYQMYGSFVKVVRRQRTWQQGLGLPNIYRYIQCHQERQDQTRDAWKKLKHLISSAKYGAGGVMIWGFAATWLGHLKTVILSTSVSLQKNV